MKLLAPVVLLLAVSAALYKTKEIYSEAFYKANHDKKVVVAAPSPAQREQSR